MAEQGTIERYWSSALILCVGLAVALYAYATLNTGTFSDPGPGGFPLVLGLFLIAIGAGSILTIAWKSVRGQIQTATSPKPDGSENEADSFEIGTTLLVILSLASFAVLIETFGMGPAIFSQLLISASIGNKLSWSVRLVLALAGTAAACVMFLVFLSVPVPFISWPFGR
jgi:hypothetical protein